MGLPQECLSYGFIFLSKTQMTNYIFTYLAPNKLAGLINNSTKKEKMSQSKADKIRTNIENWTTSIFTILGRFFIAVLVLASFSSAFLYQKVARPANTQGNTVRRKRQFPLKHFCTQSPTQVIVLKLISISQLQPWGIVGFSEGILITLLILILT